MNKKTQLVCLALVLFVFLATEASASVVIDIEIKPEFTVGDTVSFNYTFLSDSDEEINYIAVAQCPEAPLPLLEIRNTQLKKNTPYKEGYVYIKVKEDTEPQNCNAIVGIIEPFNLSEYKPFTITTNPSFSFNILTCKDQSCSQKSKVFVRNSDIYLDYSSEVSNPTVTATLTYPDKTIRQITLPTSIKAEQTGTYTLDITASKEGYKTITKKEQFAVIEKGADISSGSVCNANGICDTGENYRNCPQDCLQQRAEYSGCNFNGICDDGEDAENCPWDCLVQKVKTVCIVNGICEQGEDYQNCPQDCLAAEAGKEKYDPILTFVINTLFSIILLLIVITIFIIGLKRLFKTKEENGA